MTRRFREMLVGLTLVAGCQAPRPTPPAPLPLPATQPIAAPAAESDVARTNHLAAEQAKSIERLLAAKEAGAADPAAPPDPSRAAGRPVAVARVSKPNDGFRPVPPMGSPVSPTASPPPEPTPPPVVPQPDAPPAVSTPVTPTDPPPARPAAADDPLERRLTQKAGQSPRDLGPQFDAQLLHFLKDDKVPTADAVAGLDSEDRDVLTTVLDGLTNFRNGMRQDGNQLVTRKIRPLIEMADRLRSRADLALLNACVCRTIRGYGDYDPITPLRLSASGVAQLKLYYEIENVVPRLDTANLWATKLVQDIVLFDEAGRPAEKWPSEPISDVCRNRRRDFYIAQKFQLAPKLAAGNYTLKITLSDLFANRVSETSLPLTILPLRGPAPVAPAGPPLPR